MSVLLAIYITGALATSATAYCLDPDEAISVHVGRGAAWFLLLPLSVMANIGARKS